MSHFCQRCDIKPLLIRHEIEPTINKALLIMIPTDPLRIAEFSYLVYYSCFYPEQQAYPTQNSLFLLLSTTSFLEKRSQIAIIQNRLPSKLMLLKIAEGFSITGFSCKYSKILNNNFFMEHLPWLLLRNQSRTICSFCSKQ